MMALDPEISNVQTFVADVEAEPVEKVLKKFQGRRSARTWAAVQRIRAKKRKIKIPRNLLRQLWRITGGWELDGLKSGWEDGTVPGVGWKQFAVGDLQVLSERSSYKSDLLLYRGTKVAHIRYYGWRDTEKAKRALADLGVPYKE